MQNPAPGQRTTRRQQTTSAACRRRSASETTKRLRPRTGRTSRAVPSGSGPSGAISSVIVVAALALTILLKAFVVQVFSIPSGSMENTLLPGDRILVNKIVYRFRPIDRGDIVVFSGAGSWDPPTPPPSSPVWDDATNLVGIAGPGHRLRQARDRRPRRPRGLLQRPGPGHGQRRAAERVVLHLPGSGAVPDPVQHHRAAGRLWVMGDNRGDSDDSRYRTGDPGGGTIPESAVVGRAFLIIWPLSRSRRSAHPEYLPAGRLSCGGRGRRSRRRGRRRRRAPPCRHGVSRLAASAPAG